MRDGLAGRPSSLFMIPTYLTDGTAVPRNQPVIVMDAGGTNFRIAEVHFDDLGAPVVEGFAKYPMPGTQEELSCDAFFDRLAGYIMRIPGYQRPCGILFLVPHGDFAKPGRPYSGVCERGPDPGRGRAG